MTVKAIIPKILQRVGYRGMLNINTVVLGGFLLLFATITAATPVWLIVVQAFFYGGLASMQYSSMNTLVYADIAPKQTSSASSIASTMQQMSISFGVAAAGLCTALFVPDRFHTDPAAMIHGVHKAFLVLGTFTILSTAVFWRLKSGDGGAVSQKKATLAARPPEGGNLTPGGRLTLTTRRKAAGRACHSANPGVTTSSMARAKSVVGDGEPTIITDSRRPRPPTVTTAASKRKARALNADARDGRQKTDADGEQQSRQIAEVTVQIARGRGGAHHARPHDHPGAAGRQRHRGRRPQRHSAAAVFPPQRPSGRSLQNRRRRQCAQHFFRGDPESEDFGVVPRQALE